MSIISPITLLIVPIIGSIVIVLYPSFSTHNSGIPLRLNNINLASLRSAVEESNLKKIAIITSLFNFLISVVL